MKEYLQILFTIIGIAVFISAVIYLLYKWYLSFTFRKGKRKSSLPKFEYPLLAILLLSILTFGVYTVINESVYRYRHNSFAIEIEEDINNINFEKLYDEIYTNSRADGPILFSLTSNRNSFYLNSSGEITEINLQFVVTKHGKLYKYTSFYDKGKLRFEFLKNSRPNKISEIDDSYKDYKLYLQRLNTLDFNIFTNNLNQVDYEHGMKIAMRFEYTSKLQTKTVEDTNYILDFYAVDQLNNVLRNQAYDLQYYFISTTIEKLDIRSDKAGGKIIQGVSYDTITRDFVDILI